MKRIITFILTLALLLTLPMGLQARAAAPVATTEHEIPFSAGRYDVAVQNTEDDGQTPVDDGKDGEEVEEPKVELPFEDVPETSWFYGDVAFVYSQGLMNGISETSFLPNRQLTRGEAVTVLYRMAGSPETEGELPFKDVKESDYYYIPVLWAAEHSIVNGITQTTFCPGDKITRQQIAKILYYYYVSYLGLEAKDIASLEDFSDQSKVHSYAVEPLSWAVGNGLIRGTDNNGKVYLEPNGNATRAQMAALLHRLHELIEKNTEPEPSDPTEPTEPTEPKNPYGRSSMKIVEFIKGREGFMPEPEWDYSQWTVGYGICCRDDEGNRVEKYSDKNKIADIYFNLTEELAHDLLLQELANEYEVSIVAYEEKHGLTFDQGEFDALVDFTFNLGAAWTSQNYMLGRCLAEKGEYEGGYTELQLMEAMGAWCRVAGKINRGTVQRRVLNASIFLYDQYDINPLTEANFCYNRYLGGGSYLTEGVKPYEDDIDYFMRGQVYGELPVPVWTPVDDADSNGVFSLRPMGGKTFLGWFTDDGEQITPDLTADNCYKLTARWE